MDEECLELLLVVILHISAHLHMSEERTFSSFSSMDNMITNLLKIIQNKNMNGRWLYNEAALQKTSDIFVFMISNQDVMRNYNLIDKFISVIIKDTKVYKLGTQQIQYRKGKWVEITKKE